MDTVTPSALPDIDAVEIVDLRRIYANRVSEYMAEAGEASSWRLTNSGAQLIASLWRSLPTGEPARCHIPPFGFRFFSSNELLAEASVCWKCNNLFGTSLGSHLSFAFDASGQVSQDLLRVAQEFTGIKTAG